MMSRGMLRERRNIVFHGFKYVFHMINTVCYFKFDGNREIAEEKSPKICSAQENIWQFFRSLNLSQSCSILIMVDMYTCGVQIQSKFIICVHRTPLVEPRFSWTFLAGWPSTAELISQKS